MSDYANVDDLFGDGSVETEDVTLSNGSVVQVRGLTRHELLANSTNIKDTSQIEARNVSTCMVNPVMTVSQVERWQKSSKPKDLGLVTDAIRRLSGLADGQPKSDVQADGDNES